jgi:iron-sulfur cluster insertion protein
MHISVSAAERIQHLLSLEPDKLYMRISISGGGCSGFQYEFSLETIKSSNDIIFEEGSAKVIIDDVSLSLIEGSHLDYIQDLAQSTFVIQNPKATMKCGCGNSFSI